MAQAQWRASATTEPVSPPRPVARIERRCERRLFTLLRTGRLLVGSRETICRVRNVSANGFMADACPAPRPGENIVLELAEGQSLAAVVAWSQWDRFGAEFSETQEIEALLGRPGQPGRMRGRAVRIRPEGGFATIVCGGRLVPVGVVNISQSGMAVCGGGPPLDLPPHAEVRAEIDGLGPMKGVLCWAADGRAGIRFAESISFESLGHWLWAASLAARRPGSRS